jgi:hypothetical protein
MELTLHHIGCLVEDMAAALETYAGTPLATGASAPVAVSSQKVRVCFLPAGNGTFIEFVEPEPDNAFLLRMLRKGTSYYHVGYMCADLDKGVQALVTAGAHELTRFQSEAFGGRYCVFLITAQQQMIELIEAA